MHRHFWTGLAVATAFATLGASAQTGQSTSSPTTQSPSQREANQVTVMGCIQPTMPAAGTSGATGTSGTSGATASGDVAFMLTHAMPASSTPSSSASSEPMSRPETTGTSGSSSASSGVSYRLKADSSQLSKHVGHKVEITGTLDSTHPSGSATPGGSTTSAAPELKVEQIKMIAASCS